MNDSLLCQLLRILSLVGLLVPLGPVPGRAQQSSPPAAADGSILPFPPVPSASVAGPTLQESTMKWRKEPERLRPGAPNILIVLIDDVGFGVPDTFGGGVHTPTLSRLRDAGISYNAFHTTSICSPSRAALLTGRNHHRVGNGTIAERASDFDGYTGIIPKTSATLPEVLHHYGYKSAAFGKWHNTPANQTTAMGPFDRWPTGHGFDYFYGFLAGETSQWEPRLYENLNAIEPPHTEKYHLTEDMVDKGLAWIKRHQAFSPDKPFLMYWAPGGAHGPHHIFPEWADKYKDKFDDGWDKYRDRVFQRQKELGWIPAETKLTPRPDTLASWDSIPEEERPFQRRLMEVFAGFVEHTDAQVGKFVDGLEQLGVRENTLILYIWGDNGSSAEGQKGSISELLAQNNISNTIEQQIAALANLGGLPALGSPKTDNMYHAGWAWAGGTPFRSTKLVAAHFGGTRNPMVISWPKGIKPDRTPRSQFHHLNDIVPTLYEVIGIKHPEEVNGFKQDPMDGVSMAYTFADAQAPGRKKTQYFENNASRGIYHDGWFACTFGPFVPWDTPSTAAVEGLGREQGRVGVVRPVQGLLTGRRSRRHGARTADQDEGAIPGRGESEQRTPHRRRALDPVPSQGCHLQPVQVMAVRRDHHPHAGVHRTGSRQAEQSCGDRCRGRPRGFRGAVRPRWRQRWGHSLHGQGPARLRIQHAHHRADLREERIQDRARETQDRGQ